MVGGITDMYRDDMGHRSAKPDIGEVGVFCRGCHRWSDGQSDFCRHCFERLLGSRPLGKDSVAVWVGGQVDEHRALGIPVPAEDQDLLRRWANYEPANRFVDRDIDEFEGLTAGTPELITETQVSTRVGRDSGETPRPVVWLANLAIGSLVLCGGLFWFLFWFSVLAGFSGIRISVQSGIAEPTLWAVFASSAVWQTAGLGYLGARVYIHFHDRSAV
jgi:hypothetical protein